MQNVINAKCKIEDEVFNFALCIFGFAFSTIRCRIQTSV